VLPFTRGVENELRALMLAKFFRVDVRITRVAIASVGPLDDVVGIIFTQFRLLVSRVSPRECDAGRATPGPRFCKLFGQGIVVSLLVVMNGIGRGVCRSPPLVVVM
jgi:hypothetical protein